MQINVGFTNTAQPVSLNVDMTATEVSDLVSSCLNDTATALTLTDTTGRQLIIVPQRLAYIEVLPQRTQQVGFGVG